MEKNKTSIKKGLLILFVVLCSGLMVWSMGSSISENLGTSQDESTGSIILNIETTPTLVPKATPVQEFDATPLPTEADWERQQG